MIALHDAGTKNMSGMFSTETKPETVIGAAPVTETALATTNKPTEMQMVHAAIQKITPLQRASLAGLLLGSVTGYFFGKSKDHKWLGLLGGGMLGANLPYLVAGSNDQRINAAGRLAAEAVAIGTSLSWKSHPALGYLGGQFVGTTAVAAGIEAMTGRNPYGGYKELEASQASKA